MVKQVFSDREEAAATARSDIRYKGVRKRKWGKWVSEIRLPNSRERIWLGSYDSPVKAARAFDAALFCLRGTTAKFNFPDNPPAIDGGRSLTPSQIQAAAARFANSDTASTARMEQSTSDFQTGGYSSPSVSDGTTVQVELDSGDSTAGWSFSDLIHAGSGNFRFDYGYLPGVDEYSGYFLGGSSLIFDYAEENFEEVVAQDPFLWNF